MTTMSRLPDFSTANLERNADLWDEMRPLDDAALLRVIATGAHELRHRYPRFTLAQLAVEIAKAIEAVDEAHEAGIP